MTDDLNAIRARLAAITPGEWRVVCDERWHGHLDTHGPHLSVVHDISTTLNLGAVGLLAFGSSPNYEHAEENATFIAHAPADMRALLDAADERIAALDQRISEAQERYDWRGESYERQPDPEMFVEMERAHAFLRGLQIARAVLKGDADEID